MSEKEAARLIAVYEVFVRLAREKISKQLAFTRPREVVFYLYLRYCGLRQEIVGALLLDEKNRLLADREFFRGSACRVTADPRPILRAAILAGAAGIILFHTHPHGDPSPSQGDKDFTDLMRTAAAAVGVTLYDHLIVAGLERWHSFYSEGYSLGI